MSKRKFLADKIGKQFIPGQNEEEDSSESEYSEENLQPTEYHPSKLRDGFIPKDGVYEGVQMSWSELEQRKLDVSDDSEEDDFSDQFDSDNMPLPAQEGADELLDELDELEQNEGESLIDSLKQQQEADLWIAQGTKSLNKQYLLLMALRFMLQKVLILVNQLPPTTSPDDPTISPYEIAAEDPEVAQMLQEVHQSACKLLENIRTIKQTLEQYYDWTEPDEVGNNIMEIIAHWGQRLRLSSGMKKGSVINRPIEQQIELALNDREVLIRPSRYRDENENVFGLIEHPSVLNEIYNDYHFYQRMLAEYLGKSVSTTSEDRVKVNKPQKQMIKSKRISYEEIPNLQHFMTSTMKPIPDYVDALFNSLMK